MKYNRIEKSLYIRSLLIALTSAILGYFLIILDKTLFFIPLFIAILLLVQIRLLIKQTQNFNRKVLDYIASIKYAQLNTKNEDNKTGSFDHIRESVNDLVALIQESKLEKELHKQHLNLIIDYIKVGLISYHENHEIVLINKAAKEILLKNTLSKIEDISSVNKDFFSEILNLKNRENKLCSFNINGELITLTISKSVLKIDKKLITNITFQDIRNEIVQNEIESWQKLIKVLRHEILNSITPISTLTDTILFILQNFEGTKTQSYNISADDMEDIKESMKSIKSRSNGLFEFVNTYREIGKIPVPTFKIIFIYELIQSVKTLYENEIEKNNIDFIINQTSNSFKILADQSLLQQVLINLIKNSIEALKNSVSPKIIIDVIEQNNNVHISIIDNGMGISEKDISKIFIPMYTTKPNGTGIGLFLSRQIVQLHHGSMQVISKPNESTSFILKFPLLN